MVQINREKCIGCGACKADCVMRNIEMEEGKAQIKGSCINCGHCLAVCPMNAVIIPEYDPTEIEEYTPEAFTVDPDHFLNAVKFRRSVRSYTDRKVDREVLQKIADAGRYSATAVNFQDNSYIFIQEELPKMKELVWEYIEEHRNEEGMGDPASFLDRYKADPEDDFLFRDAPVVILIAGERDLDVGMAAQNMEMMAVSLGLGMLFNGYLRRMADTAPKLREWLGIEDKKLCACMLLGYPKQKYLRTVPRKDAEIIWK